MGVSLLKKIMGLTFVSVAALAIIISIQSISTIRSNGETEISLYRTTLLSERQETIRGYVDMAAKVLDKMSPEEAKLVARNMRYGQNGYIWIHDFNNVMLSHPDPRLEGKNQSELRDPDGVYIVRELTKVVREKGEGFVNYKWKMPGQEALKPKISFARVLPSKNWIVGTGVYTDDIDAAVTKQRNSIEQHVSRSIILSIVVTVVFMVILLISSYYMVRKFIVGPVEAISGFLKNFNDDLTKTIPVTTNDEVGVLASWLNEHLRRMGRIIRMVTGMTDKVNSHAAAIASTMEQQAGFGTQLSSSVVEISSTMEEFSATASQIAQHSHGVVERADITLEDSKKGAEKVENLTFKINDISSNIQTNLSEIVELGKKSKEINKIMEIINNIANQTKLIAFNAALEAASAGEAGKRFGVVAVEIRRLADSVVESTTEIEGKITEILDSVNRLVMSSEKSFQLIQEAQEYASHTVVMLIESVDGVEQTAAAARQISLSTQQQQIASGQVVLALKEIEQGVRFSTDSIHQANDLTAELAELSVKLKELLATFTTRDSDAAAETAEEADHL